MITDKLFQAIDRAVRKCIQQNAGLGSPGAFVGHVVVCVRPDQGESIQAEYKMPRGCNQKIDEWVRYVKKAA